MNKRLKPILGSFIFAPLCLAACALNEGDSMPEFGNDTPRELNTVRTGLDGTVSAIQESLRAIDPNGQLKFDGESFSAYCGDQDHAEWQTYTTQGLVFRSEAPAGELGKTNATFDNLLNSRGFGNRVNLPSADGESYWEAYNDFGDKISIYIHSDDVRVGGFASCFPAIG